MTPLSPIGQQRRQAAEPVTTDIASVVSNFQCYSGYPQEEFRALVTSVPDLSTKLHYLIWMYALM
jgi:hypothetical protein